jgi:hypothetical protein
MTSLFALHRSRFDHARVRWTGAVCGTRGMFHVKHGAVITLASQCRDADGPAGIAPLHRVALTSALAAHQLAEPLEADPR